MRQAILIDGKWLAFREHFSHLNLKASNGTPTGMLYGFLSELLRLNRLLPEALIIVCWDGEGPTWRHKAFPAYKANRQPNPEFKRMLTQTDLLIPLLGKLGLWVLKVEGVEADDMIGMAATRLSEKLKAEVRIYSKDRDMFQLVNDYVWVWPDPKLSPLRRSDIEKWLGVPFSALMEIRAMAGDPGDNLHGLPGVGHITAVKLWKQGFRLSDLSNGPLYDKYKKHWLRVREEYRLAQIVTDPLSDVWPEKTSKALVHLLYRLHNRPERDVAKGEQHRREVYEFLSEYDLNELLAARQKLFRLP